MKKKKRAGINCLVPFLFAVYMVLLVWIILFKLQLSIHDLDTVRNINLIPFHYENEIGMNFHLKEVLENIGIFIPFGIYLCMFRHEPNLKKSSFLFYQQALSWRFSNIFLQLAGQT